MIKITYGKRIHAGTLKESIETSIKITQEEFQKLEKFYKYYGYDKRVNQLLFIVNDMRTKYTWLYIQIDEE